MGKVLTVVGARPQFIKAAALSRVMRKSHREVLVHTGQHHDANMSDIFFEELDIPKPDYNLGIAGGSHAQMTGRMLIALEEVIEREEPDLVMVYGDTNSTIAAAMAAVKLHVPVAHVEAGNRVGTLDNPEEVNRILTDHIARLHFACVESAMVFLAKENLLASAHLVGDPMYDAYAYYIEKARNNQAMHMLDIKGDLVALPNEFNYLTCHRQENTDYADKLDNILAAANTLEHPTIYPVHPRNRRDVLRLMEERGYKNLIFLQPVGYLTSLNLVSGASRIITDSGGVQREAFFAGVPCVTVLDFVCWPETMVDNRNQLSKPITEEILSKFDNLQHIDPGYQPFGDGHACERITNIIGEFLS